MKVLLVNPPIGMADVPPPLFTSAPLGLGYVAAVLEQNDIDVKVIDGCLEGLNSERLAKELDAYSPDVVGVSVVTPRIKQALEVSEVVKERRPETITVLGGPHITALSDDVIKNKAVDVAVIGEGEYTMTDLVKTVESSGDFSDVKGILYKKNGKVIRTALRPMVKDLDEIPHPAFHLLSLGKYTPYPTNTQSRPGNFANIITSRGCPHLCTYCDVKLTFGRLFRTHSPEYVIAEIEYLYNKYNVRNISFRDSIFNLKKKRIKEVCQLIIDRGLNISWECNGRVNSVDEDLLRTMKAAGCYQIQYGVESGNQEVLNNAERNTTIEQIKEGFRLTKKAGLEVHGYFMIGLPGETKETIKETIKLARDISPDLVGFAIAVPFPGSEFYDWAKKNNYLKIKDWTSFTFGSAVVETPDLSINDVVEAQKKALRSYYIRPKAILRQIRKIKSFKDFKTNLGYAKLLLFKTKDIYRT